MCTQIAEPVTRLACFDTVVRSPTIPQRGRVSAWLFDWQTIIAGILAVVAAGFSVAMVRRQIALAQGQENDRIRRRHDATRASLPHTLMAVLDFAQASIDLMRNAKLETNKSSGDDVESSQNSLPVPLKLISALERMIEAAPEGNIRDTLSDIIARIQVNSARLRTFMKPETTILPHFVENVIDAAELYSFAASLFPYARRESDKSNYPGKGVDICASLRRLGFSVDSPEHKEIYRAAEQRENSSALLDLKKRSGD